jgi:hypothetical protein
MTKLKKIYAVYVQSPEMELFFDENGKYITGWSCNDACYRDEYMSSLFTHCGYEIVYDSKKTPKALIFKTLKDLWGINKKGIELVD